MRPEGFFSMEYTGPPSWLLFRLSFQVPSKVGSAANELPVTATITPRMDRTRRFLLIRGPHLSDLGTATDRSCGGRNAGRSRTPQIAGDFDWPSMLRLQNGQVKRR